MINILVIQEYIYSDENIYKNCTDPTKHSFYTLTDLLEFFNSSAVCISDYTYHPEIYYTSDEIFYNGMRYSEHYYFTSNVRENVKKCCFNFFMENWEIKTEF